MIGQFHYPSNIVVQEDGLYDFNNLFLPQIKRLFVVSGKSAMKEHKVLEKLENISQDNNIAIEIHNGIGTNPSNLDADSAAEHCLEFHPDTIMGLGAGQV